MQVGHNSSSNIVNIMKIEACIKYKRVLIGQCDTRKCKKVLKVNIKQVAAALAVEILIRKIRNKKGLRN